jgi:ABC-type polysaccharide/polyol phosphate export permease
MNIRRYLNLLREIAFSQFKIKDQSTVFGFVWSFLNPLAMLLILYAFFSMRMGAEIEHYAIYILIGVIQYNYFATATSTAMRSLYSMKQLATSTIFPKDVLVVGVVVANAVEFILSMLICVVIACASGIPISWAVFMLPLVIILQAMTVLWIGFILATLFVFIKDLGHIYEVFLRVLFFVTPIFYALSFAGNGLPRYVLLANPLTHLIGFSRDIIINGKPFPAAPFAILLFANLILLLLSIRLFKKFEKKFAEYL